MSFDFVRLTAQSRLKWNEVPRTRWLLGWLCVAAFLFVTGTSPAQLPESTAIAFEQIDDLSSCEDWLLPFVCVYDGKQLDLVSRNKKIVFYGFLKNESDQDFTLIGPDLRNRTFGKESKTFAEVDFAEYSKDVFRNKDMLHLRNDGSKVDRSVQLLVLSRAAYQRGDFESYDNFQAATGRDFQRKKLANYCRSAFADAEFKEILFLFGDLNVSRPQILARVKRYLDKFPDTRFFKLAAALEDDLIVMATQDSMHETPQDIALAPLEKQIDEWIFQLRNQNAVQASKPGEWDVFWKDIPTTTQAEERDLESVNAASAAMQLVKIGINAVPKLIERIGDSMPTRSAPYQKDFYYFDKLLTVGQCAELVLSKIAGQRFGDGLSSELARAEARAWYEAVAIQGEKQYLLERVQRGDAAAFDSSVALIAKFPEVAFDCIVNAIAASKDTRLQTKFLEQIGPLPLTEKTAAYLVSQLKNARELETRMVAARILLPHDRETAMNAMIQELQKMVSDNAGGHWQSEEIALISFLSKSDSVDAIQKILEVYDTREPEVRTSIILAFLDPSKKSGEGVQLSATIEGLLVHALSDTVQRLRYTLSTNEGVFENPRNCELAGLVLQTHLPAEYRFEFPLPAEKLEKQRLFAIKYWHGKQLLAEKPNGMP